MIGHHISQLCQEHRKRLFHPIEFRVAAGGSAGLTERNELAGESRTRSF